MTLEQHCMRMLRAGLVLVLSLLIQYSLCHAYERQLAHTREPGSHRPWDGVPRLKFDPDVCKDQRQLKWQAMFHKPTPRLSPAMIQEYLTLSKSGQIEGWIHSDVHVDLLQLLFAKQHSINIYGSVGEFGVHHGRYFIPISGYADAREPAVAIDLFQDMQHLNVDGAGKGNSDNLKANIDRVGLNMTNVHVWPADTTALTTTDFVNRQLPLFRFLSIDASHRLEAVIRDLQLASCISIEGAIVVVDDAPSADWLGVMEGLALYLNKRDKVGSSDAQQWYLCCQCLLNPG
jgi:hypothetical protein